MEKNKDKEDFSWSGAQAGIIDNADEMILVSAAAGSGKTKVVIGRIMRQILNGQKDIDKFLLLTFTDASAQEMKNRIYESLNKAYIEEEKKEKKIFLQNQLDKFSTCQISTFHSFCNSVVMQYFYLLDIEPNVKLIDDISLKFYQNISLENTFKKFEKDEGFLKLKDRFATDRTDGNLKIFLIKVYEYLSSKLDKWKYFEKTISYQKEKDIEKNMLVNEYVSNKKKALKEMLSYVKEIETSFVKELKDRDKYQLKLNEIKNYIENTCNTQTNAEFFKVNLEMDNSKMPIYRNLTLTEEELKTAVAYIKDCVNEVKEEIYTASNHIFKGFDKEIDNNGEYLETIYRFLKEFEIDYELVKKNANALDYNDLEKYMLILLQKNEIVDSLREKYDYIYIDEYQDTGEIQEKIVMTISKNQTNVTMVGDNKQSIYLFRRNDPDIFMNKYNKLLEKKIDGSLHILGENFRSSANILEFCNFIFKRIMNVNTTSIEYDDKVKFKLPDKKRGEKTSTVKIYALLSDAEKKKIYKDENEEIETVSFQDLYDIKNDELVKIKEKKLIEEAKVAIYEIENALKDGMKYKDIAILLPSKKNRVDVLLYELMKRGIPVNTAYQFDVFKEKEVEEIISLLRLIDNFYDDLTLINVICGRIFKFTNEEISKIRLQNQEVTFFHEAFLEYAKKENDELSNKVRNVLTVLNKMKEDVFLLNLGDFIEEIIEIYSLKPFEKERERIALNNMDKFINLARNDIFDKNLSNFIKYIDSYQDSLGIDSEVSAGGDSVTISTIHKSKGLEYNKVILMDMGSVFFDGWVKSQYVLQKDYCLGLKNIDLKNRTKKVSLFYDVIHQKQMLSEHQEKIRLLYVALSRAVSHLTVIGTLRKSSENLQSFHLNYEINNCKNFLEMLISSLSDNELKVLKREGEFIKGLNEDVKVKYQIIRNMEEFETSFQGSSFNVYEFLKSHNEKKYEKLENFDYAYKNAGAISQKNTVTALMNFEDEKNTYALKDFNRKRNDKIEDEKDYALIGTYYHAIMEKAVSENLEAKKAISEISRNIMFKSVLSEVSEYEIRKAIEYVRTLLTNETKIYTERKFLMNLPINQIYEKEKYAEEKDKVLIQGIIDLLIVDDKNKVIYLLDYKTSRMNEMELKEKYAFQLDLYSKSLLNSQKNYGDYKIIKIIYSFFLNMGFIV